MRQKREGLNRLQKTAMTLLAACAMVTASLRYVAPPPAGDDTNDGFEGSPWATVGMASQSLTQGDTVYVRAGTYRITEQIQPQNSGVSGAWITYAGYPGEEAIIDGSDATSASTDGGGLINIRNKQYICVRDLSFQNSRWMGIRVENGDSIEIIGNTITMTYSCGIGVWGCAGSWCSEKTWSRDIRVIGNEVDRPNMPEMCFDAGGSPCNTPPTPHEGISIAAVDGFEVAHNEVHHGKKEGIDCKETSRNGTIHHNHVHHHLERPWTVGIYVDSWFDSLYNVEIYDNLIHDCDDGISIGAEDGPVARDIFVHHNVLYNFGWRGITLDGAGQDNMRRNIWIYNNTVYNADQAAVWVQTESVDSIFVLNNICAGGWGRLLCDPDMASHNVVIDYNLVDATTTNTEIGTNAVVDNPLLADTAAHDFSLTQDSPAINAGHPDSQYNDPDGSRCDIGAIPFGTNWQTVFRGGVSGRAGQTDLRPLSRMIVGPRGWGSEASVRVVFQGKNSWYDTMGRATTVPVR